MTPPKMYPCSFQWDISNLSVTPIVPGKGFVSPCFTADVLGHTRWNLWFYPKGKEHPRHMAIFLQRCQDECLTDEVFVNVRLLVESHSVRFCRMKLIQSARFARGQVVGFTKLALSDSIYLPERDWPYDNFQITCEMSLSDQVAGDDPRWNPRTDLRCLSEDTGQLFQFYQHHDLLLTSQGSEFRAHRAVLASRSPFFERLLRSDDAAIRRLDMSEVPPDVLARVLLFIYSGVVDTDDGGWSQLMEAARQFRMEDLVRRLLTFPKSFVAVTEIEVDNMFLVWNDPFRGPPCFKSISKSSKPYFSQLQLRCQFVWDDCHGNGDYVDLAIRLAGVWPEVPVFILVYVQLYDGEEILLELHASHHVAEDETWWEQSFPIEDLEPDLSGDKDYRLLFEVNMCVGTHTSFIREEIQPNQDERTPVAMDDFRQFSNDLSHLLSKGTFSDFTIVCDDVVFKAHRCILASRSPVFRGMLEHNMLEKMTNTVHINDVRPQVMRTLLQYLYSGVLPNLEYPDICELYAAADKYAVKVLKDRCGSLLVEKLDPANVELVLRLSDLHSDKVLLCRVKNYVRDSHKVAMDLRMEDISEGPAVYL